MRRPLAFTLLAVSAVTGIAFFAMPFLDLSWGAIAGVMGALFIAGEAAFYLGVLLLGRDVVKWLKDLVQKLKES